MSTLFKIGGYRSKPTHTSNVYTRPLKIDTNKEMPKDKYANANPISGKKKQLCESEESEEKRGNYSNANPISGKKKQICQ